MAKKLGWHCSQRPRIAALPPGLGELQLSETQTQTPHVLQWRREKRSVG